MLKTFIDFVFCHYELPVSKGSVWLNFCKKFRNAVKEYLPLKIKKLIVTFVEPKVDSKKVVKYMSKLLTTTKRLLREHFENIYNYTRGFSEPYQSYIF